MDQKYELTTRGKYAVALGAVLLVLADRKSVV